MQLFPKKWLSVTNLKIIGLPKQVFYNYFPLTSVYLQFSNTNNHLHSFRHKLDTECSPEFQNYSSEISAKTEAFPQN